MTDREKMLVIVKMAGLVQEKPRPTTDRSPADRPNAFLRDLLKRFYGTAGALWSTLGLEVLAASSMGGLGLGHKSSLFCVTMAPLTTSSLRSTSYSLDLLIIDWKNLLMLFE